MINESDKIDKIYTLLVCEYRFLLSDKVDII